MSVPNLTSYELILPLARDGNDETWLGRATTGELDDLQLVIVESLSNQLTEREDLLDKIVQHAQHASALDHSNLIETCAAGQLEGRFCIAYAFPRGDTLDHLLAAGRPSMRATLRLFADILQGLAYVHDSGGTFHGAFSPSVVSVGWDGRARIQKVGTEKLVRKVRHNLGALNTRQLSYLSPEHCMNEPLDERTDIFNVGIVLWELLTGRLLFEEEDEFERMRAICEQQAPPPTRFNDNVPPLLNSLVLKALSIEPESRFSEGNDLMRAFKGVLSRAKEKPAREDVTDYLESVAPQRYQLWKSAERARRKQDMQEAIKHIAMLYGVDPDESVIGGRHSRGGDASGRPDREKTKKTDTTTGRSSKAAENAEKLQKLRSMQPDQGDSPARDADTNVAPTPYADDAAGSDDRTQQIDLGPNDGGPSPDELEHTIDQNADSLPLDEWEDQGFEGKPVEDVTVEQSVEEARALGAFSGETSDRGEETDENTRSAHELLMDDAESAPGEADAAPTEQRSSGGQVSQEPPPTEQFDPDDAWDEVEESTTAAEHGSPDDDTIENTEVADDEETILREPEDDGDARGEPEPQSAQDALFAEESEVERDNDSLFEDSASAQSGEAFVDDEPGESSDEDLHLDRQDVEDDKAKPESSVGDKQDRDQRRARGPSVSGEPEPDDIADGLRRMSIDDWLDEEEEEEDYREPFPLEDVIEDRGKPGQERVREPAVELIRIGQNQPLDVSVLRGRDAWSLEGESLKVKCKGSKALLGLAKPAKGWLARANNPGERETLPEAPARVEINPGDIAEITDEDVTYRIRFFHPPKSPNHIQKANIGRSVGLYGAAVLAAIVFHGLAALGIITLHTSFGVALSIKDKPKKEVFAEGKLKKQKQKKEKKKKKKKPPKPPKPPKPEDPAEQKAKVPEEVKKELKKRLDKKIKKSKDKSKADALAAAFKGPSDDSNDSIKEAVSNIDAVNSPSGNSTLKVGGKIKPGDGKNVKITTGDGSSKLGDIGSKINESTGQLAARKKKGKVRGKVSGISSQTKVEGRLARSKVLKVINQHMGEIQGCYEQELLTNAGLAGKVTLEWTITRSGTVSGARQKSSTLGSAKVSNCILAIIRRLKFPKPKGGSVSIAYPFIFRSGG